MAAQQRRKSGGKVEVGKPKGRGSSAIRLPSEKSVRSTDASVPVKPVDVSDVPDHPTDPAAVDRRRQIVGSDEPRGRTDRKRGNAAR